MHDLEDEAGERLFERDRRRVALTAAGQALLPRARELLAGTVAALDAVREAGRQAHGTLRIGNIGTLAAPFLPGSLAAVGSGFPARASRFKS